MPNEPSIMPTKVAEMNMAFCGSVEKPVFSVTPSTVPAMIDIEAVEEHPDADQEHDAAVEWTDRQPIQTAARVY